MFVYSIFCACRTGGFAVSFEVLSHLLLSLVLLTTP